MKKTDTKQNDLLTLTQACKYLQISEPTMRKLLREKKIPRHKPAGQWRFFRSELEEWVKEN